MGSRAKKTPVNSILPDLLEFFSETLLVLVTTF